MHIVINCIVLCEKWFECPQSVFQILMHVKLYQNPCHCSIISHTNYNYIDMELFSISLYIGSNYTFIITYNLTPSRVANTTLIAARVKYVLIIFIS